MLIDAQPVTVSRHVNPGLSLENNPRVTWNGTTFVLVWQDAVYESSLNHGSARLQAHAERLSAELTPLEPLPIGVVTTTTQVSPNASVASSGNETFIVYYSGSGGRAVKILSAAGQLSEPKEITGCTTSSQVVWDGQGYSISCFDEGSIALRLSTDGLPIAHFSAANAGFRDPTLLAPFGNALVAFFSRRDPFAGNTYRAWIDLVYPDRVRPARH